MSKSSNKRLPNLLKAALAILCIVAASVGATLYVAVPQIGAWLNPFDPSHPAVEPGVHPAVASAPAPTAPIDVPAPIFLDLEPFTAMLHDAQGRRRVLYVGITLRVANDETRTLFTEYMPEVRDRILRTLSVQDPIEVQTPDGRTRLVQELSSALQAPYHPHLPSAHIHGVLFTAFVVQ